MQDWLVKYPDLTMVYALSDTLAVPAMNVAERQQRLCTQTADWTTNPACVMFVSVDGIFTDEVVKGRLYSTELYSPEWSGYAFAELANAVATKATSPRRPLPRAPGHARERRLRGGHGSRDGRQPSDLPVHRKSPGHRGRARLQGPRRQLNSSKAEGPAPRAGPVACAEMSVSEPPVLRMTGITKRFPGTLALDGVDLDGRGGHHPRPAGRERRGQVDAPRRSSPATTRRPPARIELGRRAGRDRRPGPRARPRASASSTRSSASCRTSRSRTTSRSAREPTRGLVIDEEAVRRTAPSRRSSAHRRRAASGPTGWSARSRSRSASSSRSRRS